MQFRDYETLLILAVFIVSGISFLPGKVPRITVRLTVAVVGISGVLLIAGGMLFAFGFAAGFGARSLGQDGPRFLGGLLLVLYFAVCSLSCLPILSKRNLIMWGLGLHFVYLPVAVLLTALGTPAGFFFYGYISSLSLGLCYAMLWFRMVGMEEFSRSS
jgi:hypothetical protein